MKRSGRTGRSGWRTICDVIILRVWECACSTPAECVVPHNHERSARARPPSFAVVKHLYGGAHGLQLQLHAYAYKWLILICKQYCIRSLLNAA
jgi:hypothetical protein